MSDFLKKYFYVLSFGITIKLPLGNLACRSKLGALVRSVIPFSFLKANCKKLSELFNFRFSHFAFWVLLFTFYFLLSLTSFAQKQIPYDTSSVEPRTFSDSAINAFKNNREFQYYKMTEPPESWWDRFWDWFWMKIDEIFSTQTGRNTVWTIFLVIGVAAIAFIIWKTSGSSRSGLFSRKAKGQMNYNIGEENIHDISFEEAISNAVTAKNYRLAVRLLYLQCLKFLSDKSYIDWQQNKTNYAYVKEMKDHAQYKLFADLTDTFEHTWYGNYFVTPENYNNIQEQFREFKQ